MRMPSFFFRTFYIQGTDTVLGNGSLFGGSHDMTEALWAARYPQEPFTLDLAQSNHQTTDRSTSYKQKSMYDLISAAVRQRLFYPKVR